MEFCYCRDVPFDKMNCATPIGTSQPPWACSKNYENFKVLLYESIEKKTLISNPKKFWH
jgi:hypothetical protein